MGCRIFAAEFVFGFGCGCLNEKHTGLEGPYMLRAKPLSNSYLRCLWLSSLSDGISYSNQSRTTMESKTDAPAITTIIFDVDDSLYDRSTGFSVYRNGPCIAKFMVDRLKFPDEEAAMVVRNEYFARTHATAKGLKLAEEEGRLPEGVTFDAQEMADYWATNMKFDLLSKKEQVFKDLSDCPLKLVAFSNGPRAYVKRTLETLGLFDLFGEERLFAVDDVLPHCKPEAAAFEAVLKRAGVGSFEECVMVEDSMKNIRQAKALGMKTVLISGKGNVPGVKAEENCGEVPVYDDPAVDLAMETIEELRSKAPGLWSEPGTFP